MNRRAFLRGLSASGAALLAPRMPALAAAAEKLVAPGAALRPYRGPNVVIVRFGGGVRRHETIDPAHTHSPFLLRELVPRGTLYSRMTITDAEEIKPSHGEGTLNILTGRFDVYQDVGGRPLGARFEAQAPTLFEYLRKAYAVPEHQTLIVNGEDRIDEEFYTFSNHHLYGIAYRSNVLSLYRFKTFLLRRQLEAGAFSGKDEAKKRKDLARMEGRDYRVKEPGPQSAPVTRFWESWRAHYGDGGFVNPRGDRVLTELAVRVLEQLQPKLMLVNYQDCDYVHWGNPSHYTRGIQIMDQGLRHLMNALQAHPAYRDNTVVAVVPDCGRDNNRAMAVPFQHHFGGKSAREIFALFVGPGIAAGQVIERPVQQIDVTPTLGRVMGIATEHADGTVLDEAFV